MVDLFGSGYAQGVHDAMTLIKEARDAIELLPLPRAIDSHVARNTIVAVCRTLDDLNAQIDVELMPHGAFLPESAEDCS